MFLLFCKLIIFTNIFFFFFAHHTIRNIGSANANCLFLSLKMLMKIFRYMKNINKSVEILLENRVCVDFFFASAYLQQ